MGRKFGGPDCVLESERGAGIALGKGVIGGRDRLGRAALSRSDAGVWLRATAQVAQCDQLLEADSRGTAARVFKVARLLDSRRVGGPLKSTFRLEKPPLAKPSRAGDNPRVDVGNLILGIRFIEAKSMKRGTSSSRTVQLSKTGCILRPLYFRQDEVEFPTASQTDRTFRDSRAADCVRPRRTLRPLNNLNIEDQHELAFIRETPASRTRSVSTSGR